MRGNTITMNLVDGNINESEALYQWDYGQILILEGVELPTAYEVHFSNDENGKSKTSIGDSNGVTIPDEFLTDGRNIYVWLFVHHGEDDGETEYRGIIPVRQRSEPTNEQPTPVQQDIITQAIAALNNAIEETTSNVEHYPKIVDEYWYVWDAVNEEWVNTMVHAASDVGTDEQFLAMLYDYYGGGNG